MTELLIAAAVRLADMLARENAALAAFDLPRAAGMLQEKREIAQAFTELQASAGPPTADQRMALAGPVRRLRELGAENQFLLERSLAAQTRVLEIVVGAIRPLVSAPRYGATARLAISSRPAAITLSARA